MFHGENKRRRHMNQILCVFKCEKSVILFASASLIIYRKYWWANHYSNIKIGKIRQTLRIEYTQCAYSC